jgi:hypothetical protein
VALRKWRADIIKDLGGAEHISTQQHALVDLAFKSKLPLDSIDAWLLTQRSLVNARKRALRRLCSNARPLQTALHAILDNSALSPEERENDHRHTQRHYRAAGKAIPANERFSAKNARLVSY